MVAFTASDECGSTETVASVTVVDTSPPELGVSASDLIVECGNGHVATLNTWLENNGGAIASDDGGSVTWTNDFPILTDTCSGTTNVSVIFIATDECGNSDTTSAIVTIIGTSGMFTPVSPTIDFKISPNPVRDMLMVEFAADESSIQRITLFDAHGHLLKVFHERAKEIYIPVKGYAPGTYYLRSETSRGVGTRKIVID